MKKTVLHFYLFLAAMMMSTIGIAQTVLSGTVKTKSNEPLIGVTIQLKNTSTGTVTDADGVFKLQVSVNEANTGILIFSSIGFATQEIPIGSRSTIDVILEEDTKALEEVVVTGYQSEER